MRSHWKNYSVKIKRLPKDAADKQRQFGRTTKLFRPGGDPAPILLDTYFGQNRVWKSSRNTSLDPSSSAFSSDMPISSAVCSTPNSPASTVSGLRRQRWRIRSRRWVAVGEGVRKLDLRIDRRREHRCEWRQMAISEHPAMEALWVLVSLAGRLKKLVLLASQGDL